MVLLLRPEMQNGTGVRGNKEARQAALGFVGTAGHPDNRRPGRPGEGAARGGRRSRGCSGERDAAGPPRGGGCPREGAAEDPAAGRSGQRRGLGLRGNPRLRGGRPRAGGLPEQGSPSPSQAARSRAFGPGSPDQGGRGESARGRRAGREPAAGARAAPELSQAPPPALSESLSLQPGPARSGPVRRHAGTRGHGDAGTRGRGSRRRGSSTCRRAVSRRRRGAPSFPRAHSPRPAWAWPRTPRPCPAPRGPAHAAEWSNQGSRQRLIHSRLNPRTGGRMRELADLFVQSFPPLLTHCFSKHVLKICCTLDPVLALDTQWIGKLTQTYPQG